jgi:hypothetical protein
MKAGFIAVKLYLGINSFWLLKVATPICFALEVQTYRGRLVWRGWNARRFENRDNSSFCRKQ